MAPTVYLLRHAESVHNVTKDFSIRDPSLTDTGTSQATAVASTFPHQGATLAAVVVSPLTRTIQTALAAFGHILPGNQDNNNNTNAKVTLILDPDLQERSDLPCDTGSEPRDLAAKFPGLDFGGLQEGWWAKTGAYAADDAAVVRRAAGFRKKLVDLVKKVEGDVVVVTHGVFMKFLAEDDEIDLPKAGWKAFTVVDGEEGAKLVPVAV